MPGRIPQTFIDDVLARTDLVELVESRVRLKKAGKNFLGLCPFHDEKTPSFTVSPDKQFYHCFGCGANGTAISFLMDYERMEFPEAVEELAGRAGLEIPREGGAAQQDRGLTELYELMELMAEYYRGQLRTHKPAVEYLKSRGITGETAAAFELGYAPSGWDNLLKRFGSSDQARQRCAAAGMLIKRDTGDGYYDRFRDRIIFPIRDHRGRVIGFGGRSLGDETPKYLNSPETAAFHKGRELYGLYQARQKLKDLPHIYIVEGYMDVLALAQYGVTNTAATLGVAATVDHVNRLFRCTSHVVFCFDGDEAGRKAAWRALDITLPSLREGRQVSFMFMPEGQDPDDFIRLHGQKAFENPSDRVPLTDYLLETLTADVDLASREGRSQLLDMAVPYLSRLPQGALRHLLMEDLARLAGTPSSTVEDLLGGKVIQSFQELRRSAVSRTAVTGIIELILHRPALAALIEAPDDLALSPVPGVDFLRELVELVQHRPQITSAGILEHWRGTKYEARLGEIAVNSAERTSELPDPETELLDALDRLKRQRDKQIREKLSNISRMGDLSDDDKERLRRPRGRNDLPAE